MLSTEPGEGCVVPSGHSSTQLLAVGLTVSTSIETALTPEAGTPPTPRTWKLVAVPAANGELMPTDFVVSTIAVGVDRGMKLPPAVVADAGVLPPATARLVLTSASNPARIAEPLSGLFSVGKVILRCRWYRMGLAEKEHVRGLIIEQPGRERIRQV
jgi:hypothetical protein